MAVTYKVLGQAAPANVNETTLYSMGVGKQAVVSSLTISNVTDTATTATIYVKVDNAGATDANAILKGVNIPANSVTALTLGITLNELDVISVKSATAGALTFMAFGQELS